MFPHIINPLIANAPMFGLAKAPLAAAVTKAGGLGFIGGGFDFTSSSAQLASVEKELLEAREILGLEPLARQENDETHVLPIGVGFLTFHNDDASGLIPVLRQHRPAGLWLFAPAGQQHTKLISAVKSIGAAWGLKIFVQVGSVQTAVEAVRDGADVLVVQGSDAGGHQFAKNASIITLLPEVVDSVKHVSHVSILAAGGIMDGRGIAAAMALGANGVVMGTRFVATVESAGTDINKSVLVSTQDGGISTAKSTIHDSLRGNDDLWPALYDGRAVVCGPYKDVVSGDATIEKAKETHKKATAEGNASNMVFWAGSGIGLIRDVPTAGDVVQNSRSEAIQVMRSIGGI